VIGGNSFEEKLKGNCFLTYIFVDFCVHDLQFSVHAKNFVFMNSASYMAGEGLYLVIFALLMDYFSRSEMK
jgi:hypothetical protein